MKIADSMIKKICSSMIYKRGAEYFLEGRVHIRRRGEEEITAVVDGEELYNVQVTFKDEKIDSVLCSCPYYETMQTTCKHIVAVLKQRQAELEQGGEYTNENDKLAVALCREFSEPKEHRRIRASFTLFVKPNPRGETTYEVSVSLPEFGGSIRGLENFLDCYLHYKNFKLDRNTVYNRNNMYFPENEDKVISIIAEVYETRSMGLQLYQKNSYSTPFGAAVLRRMLPYLAGMDFQLVCDGIALNNARVINGDPDILMDITAYDREIMLSLSENGIALTPDGEWFLHNETIYRTTEDWRDYFMPIYRTLEGENRMQIAFKGNNTLAFAAHVFPRLKNRRGVVVDGVDDIIINSRPEFEVYLDAVDAGITAAAAVRYGNMKFRLPSENRADGDKIVIRDSDAENRVLSFFNRFDRERAVFTLTGDSDIYDFLSNDLPELSETAELIMTERFKRLRIRDDADISLSAGYKNDIDFLEVSFKSDLKPEEIRGILASMRLGRDFFRLGDGSYMGLRDNKKLDIFRLLERLDLTNEDIYSRRKILPKFHMLYLESRKDVKKEESLKRYMDGIRSMEARIPEELRGVLRPYQEEGVRWLSQLSDMGLGGILADDMGLGKTLQVIAYARGIKPDKPVLIVAPSTLVYNWQRELEKFTPDASSLIISGNKETRTELLRTAENYEFIITSYPLLRRDVALYKNIYFSYCFIDEAQYIKNPKTMNAVSVKRIRADHKFAITGTPIENSLMELWSIFDFIMPGYLKSAREFRDRYGARGTDDPASEQLRGVIRPFVLRRMKKDVLSELPEKIEMNILADLNREQKAMYLDFLNEIKGEARSIITGNGNRFMLLTLLLRLRQICCHPALFCGGDAEAAGSGKLELLCELVNNGLASGHRILIFSQFRSMLDIIKKELENRGIDYFYINGSTPADERAEMAERFNSGDRSIFLVSLKAGGTGLNLVGADMVIHYDPWWNPAVTDQATDRAYRIGQTRAVQVIKLAARGTIEEKILQLQEKKRMLAEDIIRVNTEAFASLTDDEIMSLFEV